MDNGTINISSTAHPVEFVAVDDTIADVALKEKASAGLSTSISVLMSLLVTASFFLNSGLFATIVSSYKLRRSLLYLMFCILTVLNLFDVLLIMLVSLLCVANGGQWIFGTFLCRLNAFTQQFVLLATLLMLTLMAVERALSLLGRHLVTLRFFGRLGLLFSVIPVCFAVPLFLQGFPVSAFKFRYLCAIDSGSPLLYSIVQLLVYGGCFFVLLLCFGSIIKHKRVERTLPVKPQDYGAFIIESRALEEHMNLSRLVLLLALEFLAIEGPYIVLDFFTQIRNSFEMLNRWGTEEAEIPQDVDTLITLVKLFHPLFVPLLIFASCADIWTKFVNLLFCRRNPGHLPRSWGNNQPLGMDNDVTHPNVMTLYATPEGGLQLRVPNEVVPHPSMIAAVQQQQQSSNRTTAAAVLDQQQQQLNLPPNEMPSISEEDVEEGEYEEEEEEQEDHEEEENHQQQTRNAVTVLPELVNGRPKRVVINVHGNSNSRRRRGGRRRGQPPVRQAWKMGQ